MNDREIARVWRDSDGNGNFAGPRVCFSPLGKLVAVGDGRPSRLRIYEASALEQVGSSTTSPRIDQPVNDEQIRSIHFSPDDKFVAVTTAFNDPAIRLFDTVSGERHQLEGHLEFAYDTSFSADGRHLVSAGGDCTLRVWDLRTLESVSVLRGHADEVWTITRLSEDGSFLSGAKDGTILQWNLNSIDQTITDLAHQTIGALAQISITPPQITRDEQHIVALGKENTVLILDADDLTQVTRLSDFPSPILDVWALPELDRLAISNLGGQVGLYTMAGKKVNEVSAHSGPCLLWALRDNKRLASYKQGARSAKIWSIPELVPLGNWSLRNPEERPGESAAIEQLAEGRSTFATFDAAGRIGLWDKHTGNFIRNVAQTNVAVNGLAFSPTDEHLLACVGSGQIRLLNVREPKEVTQWKAHRGNTWGTAFFPDGRRILTTSSSHDTVVTIWDVTSERHIATLSGIANAGGHMVSVSPSGKMIVLVDLWGQMNVWRAPSWEEIASAEERAADRRPLLEVEQSTPNN
jgi:WD40 repeat protein